jgi:ferredoxin/flavodoxin---NADP+ reductase
METRVLDPVRRPLGPIGRTGIGPGPLGRGPLGPGPLGRGPLVEPHPVRRREFAANATLISRIELTPSVARFLVRPDADVPPFKPGQYFALGIAADGSFIQRPYSTASAAGTTGELEFLVRRVATGTFTPRLWEIAAGGRVWLGPPKGLFTLQPRDERTHLFVSTGTGLAPFISMAETLLRDGAAAQGRRVVVVHGVSYAGELAYRDRLEAWASTGQLAYLPTVSRPTDPANAGWDGLTGRTESVLASVAEKLELDPADTVAYICGNPEMIEAACAILLERGFDESAVIREHYWTAASATAA